MLSSLGLTQCSWAQTGGVLEIGVLPNISARVLLTQYQPMRDHLARETGHRVQVSTAPNWVTFHQRATDLEYDVLITAGHLARLAQIDHGYVPLLSYAPDIKGLAIYAADRPIQGIAELRGQTLGLSNPQSLVTLRGMQWLAENGLQRERDFAVIKTPTDDSIGNVVARGDAIAALISGGEYRAVPEAVRSQLRILTTFTEVPGFIVLASPRLPAADAQAIKQALLAFANGSEEGKTFFGTTGFTGIKELSPGSMDSLDLYVGATREMLAAAN